MHLPPSYIEDPRNEGTETASTSSIRSIWQGYIEDPRNEGTETDEHDRRAYREGDRYIEDPRNEGTETARNVR